MWTMTGIFQDKEICGVDAEGLIPPAGVRVSVEQPLAFSPSRRSCPSEEGSHLITDAGRGIKGQLFPPKLEWFWWVRFCSRALSVSTAQLLPLPDSTFSLLPTGVDLRGTFNSVLETASCGFQTDTSSLFLNDQHDVWLRFWDWWKGYDLIRFYTTVVGISHNRKILMGKCALTAHHCERRVSWNAGKG